MWRQSDHTVWWTDIQEQKLFKLSWSSRDLTHFQLPERLGSFGFVAENDSKLVCAFESGFAIYQPESNSMEWLARPDDLGRGCRLNDGRVAPDGSFWAGSMIEDRSVRNVKTGLYQLADGCARLVITGLGISNGISWSPPGDEMYFSDSSQQLVYRSKYPISLFEAAQHSVFARLSSGAPDGAVTDIAGRYWSAVWGEGIIRVFMPDSEVLLDISIPAPQPTCVAFGGDQGDLLFVTSAREGLTPLMLDQYPDSGNVFVYKTSTCGSPSYRYML